MAQNATAGCGNSSSSESGPAVVESVLKLDLLEKGVH